MSTPVHDPAPPRSAEGKLDQRSRVATAGLVAGVLGLTALAFGLSIYAIDPKALVITVVNGVFAASALTFYALTNLRDLRRIAAGRSTALVFLEIALVLGVVLGAAAANYFAAQSTVEWDLTRDQLFTLQEQSIRVASGLKKPVRIIGFYKPSDSARGTLSELAELYRKQSDLIELELINADSVAPAMAKQYKLTPTGSRIVVSAGDDRWVKAQSPTEQEITNALIKVAERPARKVCFLTGHGESGFPEGAESDNTFHRASQSLADEGYTIETLSLLDKDSVPPDCTVVILAGAQKGLFPNEIQALTAHLKSGGRTMLLVDPGLEHGLDSLLRPVGIEIGDDLVVDPNPASQALGFGPDAPVINKFEPHAITAPLKGNALLFYWARSVSPILGVGGVNVATLFQSSEGSWGESKYKDGGDVARDAEDAPGPMPMAVAMTKSTAAVPRKLSDEARLIVVGDSSFATNRFFSLGGNGDLLLNMAAWLAGEEADITLRPKQRKANRIPLTQEQLYGIVFFSVNLLPLVVVGFGFSIWAVRRRM